MRWVQVTSSVILKSCTFFKLLDLSRSYGKKKKKKTLINTYILIKISFNIPYLWHSISLYISIRIMRCKIMRFQKYML